jgi:hypothetical protein
LTCLATPRTFSPMCPHCGRDAPIVYRGPLAYCTACNAARPPLSAAGVNLAGKPAKLGGTVASVVGWAVMAITLGIALILGAILQAIFPAAMIGWAVGGVLSALGVAAGMVLLMGGKFLAKSGDQAALTARRDAVFALAQTQAGILRPPAVATALGVSPAEAENILTGFSRDPASGITLEVDTDGKLYYRVIEIASLTPWRAPAPAVPETPGPRVGGTQIADEPLEEEAAEPGTKTKRTRV